ncbi:vacuolar assembly protein vps41 [Trypanosoma vivax]|nr:vacuolar assembly protein vps41 [Trypanosoma vivax]
MNAEHSRPTSWDGSEREQVSLGECMVERVSSKPGDSCSSDESYDESYEEDEDSSETRLDHEDNLLSFVTLPLNWLNEHHIMVVTALRRFIIIGTNRGDVVLLEAKGGAVFRVLHAHTEPVSDISCDAAEEHVASCDKTGMVVVSSTNEQVEMYRKDFGKSVRSVALHPHYKQLDEHPLVLCGTDDIILVTKSVFPWGRKTTVLQQKRGKVFLVRWCGPDIIAWASERGLLLYSYPGKALLQLIPRPTDSAYLELYRCSLVWEEPCSIICGWGDWVQTVSLYEMSTEDRLRWGPEFCARTHRVDVRPPIRTNKGRHPYRVCGIAPFGTDRYLVLAGMVKQEGCVHQLEVRIVERDTFVNVYRGHISTNYRHSLQFSLAYSIGTGAISPRGKSVSRGTSSHEVLKECAYFIVCVDTVMKAVLTDDDDHVEYLISVDRVAEAYEYAQCHKITRLKLEDIGRCFMHYLFAMARYDEVVTCLPKIVSKNYAEWERWVVQFDQQGVSDLLIDVLPTTVSADNKAGSAESCCAGKDAEPTRIGEEYYELIILRCLERNILRFGEAVQRFKGLFRVDVVCRAVGVRYNDCKLHNCSGEVSEDEKKVLGDAYGLLLQLKGQYDDALQVLLHVSGSDELFQLIRDKCLFEKAMELLPELFANNEEKTVQLLLEQLAHIHTNDGAPLYGDDDVEPAEQLPQLVSGRTSPFAPLAIVRRLEWTQRYYLWVYLKALREHNKSAYAQVLNANVHLVATLFIENEPSGVLPFLREYFAFLPNLKDIYALCKKHQLLEEMVFILLRMGKEEEGLHIIVNEMRDVRKALEFIADIPSKDDQLDLYDRLIRMTAELHATLPSNSGGKYIEHKVREGEDITCIARRYGVSEEELKAINPLWGMNSDCLPVEGGGRSSGAPTAAPDVCIVPLNLMQDLLRAVVDPSISNRVALDPALVVKHLPTGEPMPHVGKCIAEVTRCKANDVCLMEAVVGVETSDLLTHFKTLSRRRGCAVRVVPGAVTCPSCHQPAIGGVVAFGCSHVYHANCVVGYLTGENSLLIKNNGVGVEQVFRQPSTRCLLSGGQQSLRCVICHEVSQTWK